MRNLKDEKWLDVVGYEDKYQVSNMGRIKSKRKFYGKRWYDDKIMKTRQSKDGYIRVKLYKNNKQKTFYLHRLVSMAFIGESDLDVNHRDGNKANNKLSNLEYLTRSENHYHAWDNGLKKVTDKMRKSLKINRINIYNLQ
ncbi:NUMOD4 domain-containing protein [Joostella sp. CR20]|uniref:NUMOD4 domain-containing protein n=1 Tax=Joostella sp. CR20 TaxID=2804312 RepID=UPI00313B9245